MFLRISSSTLTIFHTLFTPLVISRTPLSPTDWQSPNLYLWSRIFSQTPDSTIRTPQACKASLLRWFTDISNCPSRRNHHPPVFLCEPSLIQSTLPETLMTSVSFTPLHIQFYFQYASIHCLFPFLWGHCHSQHVTVSCRCRSQKFPTDTGVKVHNELPQDVPQCNVDYLELKATKTLQAQEKLLALLKKCRKI